MKMKRPLAACLLFACSVVPTLAYAADWGAMALDAEKAEFAPHYGVGGGETEQEATRNALKFCQQAGGKVCKVLVTYEECGALAVSGTRDAGWGRAPTIAQAEDQAVAGCENDACIILASDCN
jgi:hypothetical protein